MKKICISVSLVFILLLSSMAVVSASQTAELENKPCELCSDLEKTNDPLSNYEAFVGAHGIKIWARGYGTFNCNAIEDNGNRWTRVLRYPEEAGPIEYYNAFNYAFYDEEAITKINALFPIGPFSVALATMMIFPDLFRFNSQIPVREPGPHQCRGYGARLQGYISKGQTFEGTLKEPVVIDDITYHYYEIRGRCTYLPLESPAQPGDMVYLLTHALIWKNNDNFIPWDCCYWED
jgi:hypothetical protein